ncbi:TIGR01210 family radical SAM protein [Halobacteriales archaeon QH_10_67_13]|nr:MAG: TIGR01210 family radical SAM protein [Halobacteriales archaeon QH_10_67_13]
MGAHNRAMGAIRAENDQEHNRREPTRVWLDEDNTTEGVCDSLTIVLNTGGYRWAQAGGCTVCGYVTESVDGGTVTHEDLLSQIEESLAYERERAEEPAGQVKLHTAGSFLDEREIPAETRAAIAEEFADRDRIVVESLPDFIDAERLRAFTDRGLEIDVAVGLETVTDRIRHDCVNKHVEFAEFERAAAEARAAGAGVKTYLLLKPPFLSEGEAIADMERSIRRCADVEGCHTVSMNPCNVQRYSTVERLYSEDGYRPPWLWSVTAVLEATADTDVLVVSDPIGHGSDRGPHNCGECDSRVQRAIKDFNLRQDPTVFEQVSCSCERTWAAVRERERGYCLPLTN